MPAAYAAPSAVVSATPQLVRIVLDPSRLRKGPPALLLALRDDTTVVIDDDRPAAARALVDGRDETTRTAPCEPRHSPGRADQEANAKRLIAEAAVSLLTPTSSIAVDSGTTCYAVASALPRNFRGSVLTRSVPVLQQMLLHPEAIVLGLGGELLAESQVLIGPRTTAAALEISVDVFFLGANSVDVNGVYLRGDREYPVKSALIQRASRVVLLADGSKLSHTAPVKLTDLSALSMIITNGSGRAPLADRCAELGVEIVSVSEAGSVARRAGTADLNAVQTRP